MPTYQYVCTECATPLEAVQSFSDAALTECPACGGKLRKVYSAVGVVFKGSGFYKNDSRGKAATTDAPAKTETKSETKTEAKADKPAAKTESKPAASTSTT